jgi:hypothetical protein
VSAELQKCSEALAANPAKKEAIERSFEEAKQNGNEVKRRMATQIRVKALANR